MHHILVYHPVIAVWHINTGAEVLRMTQTIVIAIIRPGVILLALRYEALSLAECESFSLSARRPIVHTK